MLYSLVTIALCALLCSAEESLAPRNAGERTILEELNLFEDFVKTYNRNYQGDEYMERFQIFRGTLAEIDRLNANSKHAVYGITRFADMTPEEHSKFRGFSRQTRRSDGNCAVKKSGDVPNTNEPPTLDYRTKHVVTPVKNQAQCGSCWSFSTTGNIEGAYALKHKKLLSFSEQQLVDCSPSNCTTGWTMDQASELLMTMGGIMLEKDYPYTSGDGIKGSCKFDKSKVAAKISSCEVWDLNKNEAQLKKVLAARGPLAVAIDGSALQSYFGGIISGDTCQSTNIDHGVLLIGYGIENNVPYWLLKNSWGTIFGEDGFFRMEYNKNCLNMMDSVNGMIENAFVE